MVTISLTHQIDNFLALFDAIGFLVQEIGGVFGILVIWDVFHNITNHKR